MKMFFHATKSNLRNTPTEIREIVFLVSLSCCLLLVLYFSVFGTLPIFSGSRKSGIFTLAVMGIFMSGTALSEMRRWRCQLALLGYSIVFTRRRQQQKNGRPGGV